LLRDVPEDDRRRQMHIVDVRGRVHSGGDALLRLMATWGGRPARRARIAKVWPPTRRKIRAEYVALAERRGALSEQVEDVEPVTVRPAWTRLD